MNLARILIGRNCEAPLVKFNFFCGARRGKDVVKEQREGWFPLPTGLIVERTFSIIVVSQQAKTFNQFVTAQHLLPSGLSQNRTFEWESRASSPSFFACRMVFLPLASSSPMTFSFRGLAIAARTTKTTTKLVFNSEWAPFSCMSWF